PAPCVGSAPSPPTSRREARAMSTVGRRPYAERVVVDALLLVLMIVFAVIGYRQGFVIGALSLVGFFSGALIGLQLGPPVGRQFADHPMRVLVSLIAIFGMAVLGQALAGWLGTRLRYAITNRGVAR